MAELIYFMPTSLDGYIADDGNFEWWAPSEEAFTFINDHHPDRHVSPDGIRPVERPYLL